MAKTDVNTEIIVNSLNETDPHKCLLSTLLAMLAIMIDNKELTKEFVMGYSTALLNLSKQGDFSCCEKVMNKYMQCFNYGQYSYNRDDGSITRDN